MAPLPNPLPAIFEVSRRIVRRDGAYGDKQWSGPVSVATVDLMAMVISDAGLASTEPEWWNCSPIGCLLISVQPRGGWQVVQRGVQWGDDHFSRSFGVSCKQPVLYCYFSCTLRNRLEVWDSDKFISPQIGVDDDETLAPLTRVDTETVEAEDGEDEISEAPSEGIRLRSLEGKGVKGVTVEVTERPAAAEKTAAPRAWKVFNHKSGPFTVRRPTKLMDGSRGGQAFICSLLRPDEGHAYGIDQQAHVQFQSILLIIASVSKSDEPEVVRRIFEEEFDIHRNLGSVFKRLSIFLCFAEVVVLAFVISVFYALWENNIYGSGTPYVLQFCSLCAWSFGATGLLMMGGNPRVTIIDSHPPKHISDRLAEFPSSPYTKIHFGSLHGSIFTSDRGSCFISPVMLKSICGMKLQLVRDWKWRLLLIWFALHILMAVTIQVSGSRVATLQSQIMGITILVCTSVVRGQGISGPEEWMIPMWKMRDNAAYGVDLQGRFQSRAK